MLVTGQRHAIGIPQGPRAQELCDVDAHRYGHSMPVEARGSREQNVEARGQALNASHQRQARSSSGIERGMKLAREQGDFVRFRLGDHERDLFFLNHPDLIREALVTQDRHFTKWFMVDRIREVLGQGLLVSEGEFHLRQRRL